MRPSQIWEGLGEGDRSAIVVPTPLYRTEGDVILNIVNSYIFTACHNMFHDRVYWASSYVYVGRACLFVGLLCLDTRTATATPCHVVPM